MPCQRRARTVESEFWHAHQLRERGRGKRQLPINSSKGRAALAHGGATTLSKGFDWGSCGPSGSG